MCIPGFLLIKKIAHIKIKGRGGGSGIQIGQESNNCNAGVNNQRAGNINFGLFITIFFVYR